MNVYSMDSIDVGLELLDELASVLIPINLVTSGLRERDIR